jgi:hypothetical protein
MARQARSTLTYKTPEKPLLCGSGCRYSIPNEPDAKAILPESRNVKRQIPVNLSHGEREKLMSYRVNYLPTENDRRFL